MESLLREILRTRFVAGVDVGWEDLRRFLSVGGRSEALRAELEDAIANERISPQEFERLTSVDQDSPADVARFLREELWVPLYGGAREPVTRES